MLEDNNYIEIGNEFIHIGDSLVANKHAKEHLNCEEGLEVTVRRIEGGIQPRIGIVAPKRMKGWSDLNGMCDEQRGIWCVPEVLRDNFKLMRKRYFCAGEHKSYCRIVNTCKGFNEKAYVVEMEKEIKGGCGGDGYGNKDRCCIVEGNALTLTDVNYINLTD